MVNNDHKCEIFPIFVLKCKHTTKIFEILIFTFVSITGGREGINTLKQKNNYAGYRQVSNNKEILTNQIALVICFKNIA